MAGAGAVGEGPDHIPRAVGHHTHLEAAEAAVVAAAGVGAGAAAGDGGGADVEATATADPDHHRLVHIPRVVEVAVLVGLDLDPDPDPDPGLDLVRIASKGRTPRETVNLRQGRKRVESEAYLGLNRPREVETNRVRIHVILAGADPIPALGRDHAGAGPIPALDRDHAGAAPILALDRDHAAPILVATDAGLVRRHQRMIPRQRTGSVEIGQAPRRLVDETTREREGEGHDHTLLQAAADPDPDPDRTPLLVAAGRVLDHALDHDLQNEWNHESIP